MGELRRVLCGTPVHPSLFCGAAPQSVLRSARVSLWRMASQSNQCRTTLGFRLYRDALRSRPTKREGCTGVSQSTLRSSPIPTPLLRMPRRVFYGTGESKGDPS